MPPRPKPSATPPRDASEVLDEAQAAIDAADYKLARRLAESAVALADKSPRGSDRSASRRVLAAALLYDDAPEERLLRIVPRVPGLIGHARNTIGFVGYCDPETPGGAVLFAVVFGLLQLVCRTLRFPIEDRIAVVFCGSKKSIAAGVPMAQVIFSGDPRLGLILLPLLIYHPMQLLICGVLAGRWARR